MQHLGKKKKGKVYQFLILLLFYLVFFILLKSDSIFQGLSQYVS